MSEKFDSIEDEITHIMKVNDCLMTAKGIFASCGMAEDERAIANALYRMKQAGKVVPDGKDGTKILYRLPRGGDQLQTMNPEREPIAPIVSKIIDAATPSLKKTEETLTKPPAEVKKQALTFEKPESKRVNWWISRDGSVRIESADGHIGIVLSASDAFDLSEQIERLHE